MLGEVERRLPVLPGKAEIYTIGGTAMMLEYAPAGRLTEDIDCVIKRYREEVIEAAEQAGRDHGLREDWLNETASQMGILPETPDDGARVSYEGHALVVQSAGPERLLAMKIDAGREKDLEDIRVLLELLDARPGEPERLHRDAYPQGRINDSVRETIETWQRDREERETHGRNATSRGSEPAGERGPTGGKTDRTLLEMAKRGNRELVADAGDGLGADRPAGMTGSESGPGRATGRGYGQG